MVGTVDSIVTSQLNSDILYWSPARNFGEKGIIIEKFRRNSEEFGTFGNFMERFLDESSS